MEDGLKRRLDSLMRKDAVLIVEPNLADQATYLRQHGFAPRSRPQISDVTRQKFQWWDRVAVVVGWSAIREGLLPILRPIETTTEENHRGKLM